MIFRLERSCFACSPLTSSRLRDVGDAGKTSARYFSTARRTGTEQDQTRAARGVQSAEHLVSRFDARFRNATEAVIGADAQSMTDLRQSAVFVPVGRHVARYRYDNVPVLHRRQQQCDGV